MLQLDTLYPSTSRCSLYLTHLWQNESILSSLCFSIVFLKIIVSLSSNDLAIFKFDQLNDYSIMNSWPTHMFKWHTSLTRSCLPPGDHRYPGIGKTSMCLLHAWLASDQAIKTCVNGTQGLVREIENFERSGVREIGRKFALLYLEKKWDRSFTSRDREFEPLRVTYFGYDIWNYCNLAHTMMNDLSN